MRITSILLVFIFPTLLMAGPVGEEALYAIYLNENIEFVTYIMTAISKIFTDGNPVHDYYSALLSVSMLVGIIMASIRAYWKQSATGYVKEFGIFASVVFLLTYPVEVHIEDVRPITGNNYAKVDNIPAILAFMYGTSSYIEYLGREMADEALATIAGGDKNYNSEQVGFAKSINDTILMLDKAKRAYMLTGDKNISDFSRKFEVYLDDCVVPQIPSHPEIPRIMRNPKKDFFDAMEPSNFGITNDTKVDIKLENGDLNDVGCRDLYISYLKNDSSYKYEDFANALFATVKTTIAEKDINTSIDDIRIDGVGQLSGLKINTSLGGTADTVAQVKALITNSAFIGLTNKTLSRLNNDLTTGTDVANAITMGNAMTRLQTEGIGTFKWMTIAAPKVINIFKGAIYFYGIFILFIALIQAGDGWKIIINYWFGLIGVSLIGIGFSFASNIVSYIAEQKFIEYVLIFGGNPITVDSLSDYYTEMATYAGIMGMVATSIALAAPAMILKGQFSALGSAIGSMGAVKMSNDKAGDLLAEDIAQTETYEKRLEREAEEASKNRINKMDPDLAMQKPHTMTWQDYEAQIFSGIQQHTANYTYADNMHQVHESARGATSKVQQQISANAELSELLGSNLEVESANAGRIDGAMAAELIRHHIIKDSL